MKVRYEMKTKFVKYIKYIDNPIENNEFIEIVRDIGHTYYPTKASYDRLNKAINKSGMQLYYLTSSMYVYRNTKIYPINNKKGKIQNENS